MVPVHEHDCDECLFVGSDAPEPGEPRTNQVDMYVHLRPASDPSGHCLIRRYSSEGSNYGAWSAAGLIGGRPEKYQRVLDACRLLNDQEG